MTHSTDGGDAVIAAFEAAGSDYLFCASGSEWAPVWEALARRQRDGVPGPTYIDLLHETVAVAMAAGYALVTRRPQGVLLHAGPGLLQGSVAIHGALLAGAGMVVLSSESMTYGEGDGPDPGSQWYRNLSVVGGPHSLAAPFVKWSNQVGSVSTLVQMMTRSVEMAGRAPAGPVYLNVPVEVLLQAWPEREVKPVATKGSSVSAPADVEAVFGLLRRAERPVVVTETAGREAGGQAALVAFAEAFQIPVVEPNSAVCANFPRTHELHGGGDAAPFLDSADVIVLVSCRAPFYPPSNRPPDAAIVVIDDVPQRPHVVYQALHADHYLEGSVVPTLQELTRLAGKRTVPVDVLRRRRDEQLARHEAASHEFAVAEEQAGQSAPDHTTTGLPAGVDPVLVVATLRDLFAGDDPIVVDETITHSRTVQRHLRRSTPDSYFYVQGGLGQGIGVALGVKLAAPERPVVLTIGDGSFLYNPVIPSLDAARANDLPLLIVVLNNTMYLSMKMNHLRFYPDGAAAETGDFRGVDLSGRPELTGFAEPFGMHTETVSRTANLAPALARADKAVREGTTAIVNVTVSR